MIIRILRVEGLMILLAALVAYVILGFNWSLLLLLILVPDLFMAGYLKNTSWGATLYNIGHTYSLPLVLLGVNFVFHVPKLLPFALIWIAHIGMDRMLGFGLKHSSGFKDTHLGRIGN